MYRRLIETSRKNNPSRLEYFFSTQKDELFVQITFNGFSVYNALPQLNNRYVISNYTVSVIKYIVYSLYDTYVYCSIGKKFILLIELH